MTSEEIDKIHQLLNIEEKNVPEENRELFRMLAPSMESYLLDALGEIKIEK